MKRIIVFLSLMTIVFVLTPNVTAEWTKLRLDIGVDPTCYEKPLKYDIGGREILSTIYLMPDKKLPTFVVNGYLWFESDDKNDYINGTLLFYLQKRTGEYVLNLLRDTDYPDGMPFPIYEGGAQGHYEIKNLEAVIVRGEIESGKFTVVVKIINADTQEEVVSDYCHITLKNSFVEDSQDDTTNNNTDSEQTGDSDIPVDTTPDYDNDPKKGIFGFTTAQISIIAFLLLIVVLLSILLYSNFRKKQY